MKLLRRLLRSVCACSAVAVTACAVGPDYRPPEPETGAAFDGPTQSWLAAGQPEIEWWRSFEDAQLTSLVERAFIENNDIRIAQANVTRARALLGEGRFERYPIVPAGGSVTRQKASDAASQQGFAGTDTFYDLGLDAQWELDFFGRVRRNVQALAADYQAAEADRRDTYVIVAGEVARTYTELRGAQYRLEVAEANAENQRRTYELTQALLDGGRGTELDIVRAQAQLELTLASIPPLRAETARAIHRLSVLVGVQPQVLTAELNRPASLPELPSLVNVGDPRALLRRRADIRAAERRLAASTARVGVAVADLFPRVVLAGSAGWLSTSSSDIGDSIADRFTLGPTISWAAFDFGRVRARLKAADAEAEAQLAAYEQTVLIALEETENALHRYVRAREREERLMISANASARARDLADIRYRNGVDSFLNVLDSERRLLEAQDLLAQSETESGLALVALYKAMGGGWEVAAGLP